VSNFETSCVAGNMVGIGTHKQRKEKKSQKTKNQVISQDSETAQIANFQEFVCPRVIGDIRVVRVSYNPLLG
jgi:hypothetical protein